jgi:hypothetical protein
MSMSLIVSFCLSVHNMFKHKEHSNTSMKFIKPCDLSTFVIKMSYKILPILHQIMEVQEQ